MKNIFLIGFMGAGKSTIAHSLARMSKRKLVDTDSLIVKRENRSISEIFAEEGEEYFRRTETECIREISERSNLVVSCGGGVVLNPENVSLMKKSGVIVLLDATPEVILERVSRNNRRPLLEGKKNIEDIKALMDARMPHYKQAADLRVRSDNAPPERVSLQIIRLTKIH